MEFDVAVLVETAHGVDPAEHVAEKFYASDFISA
jgi:hypothetical protein